MSALRKNVASQVLTFCLVNASTGAALTGATCGGAWAKDGTQSAFAGTFTDLGSGQYKYVPTQGETNCTAYGLLVTATGAIPVSLTGFTTAADPTDAVRMGLTALPNAAAGANGGLPLGDASGRVTVGAIANGVIAAATFAANALDAVWSTATRVLTAGTNIVLAKGTGVTGFNDLDASGVRGAVGMAAANLDTQFAAVAGAVWDVTLSGHVTAGTTGNALNAAGSAGDPWTTALPGAYGAGSAGSIIGNRLDAAITTRLASGSYTAPDNATISAIKSDTGTILTDVNTGGGVLYTAITGVKSQTDQLAFTAGNVNSNVKALNSDTTAAANIAKTTRAIGRGTVTTGASTTSIPTSAFSPAGAAADQFLGRIVTFDADTATAALRGQATDITACSNSATPTLTVTALTTAPSSGDTFSIT